MKIRLRILLSLFATTINATAHGVDWVTAQPTPSETQSIEAQLTDYLDTVTTQLQAEKNIRLSYQVGKIDPRLNLSECNLPLSFELLGDIQKTSRAAIKVRCDAPNSWSLHVQFDAKLYMQAVTVKSTMQRLQRLSKEDLEVREMSADELRRGYYQDIAEVVGLELRRSLDAGTALYPAVLFRPQLISKGDAIMIRAASEAVKVEVPGTAMTDGRLGQQISVKNNGSGKIIRATVLGRQLVKVAL